MDHVCIAFPLKPGMTDRARTFMRRLDTDRRAEFDASERRIGISKEIWFLAPLAAGEQLIGYMEAADFGAAMSGFVASRDSFDQWFKAEMLAMTGVDLNNLPPDFRPPELLSHYEAGQAVV